MRTNIRPFLRFAAFFLVLALAVALANTCLIQTDTFVALMIFFVYAFRWWRRRRANKVADQSITPIGT